MLCFGGDEIHAGGLDAGMAQHIRQLGDVLICPIIGRGAQGPQIVGKHPGSLAKCLHFRPDLTAAHAFSASGEKDLTGGDFVFSAYFSGRAWPG